MIHALRSAGLNVREGRSSMTLQEARQLALRARAECPTPTYDNEALSHLPTEMKALAECRKGEEFLRVLRAILERVARNADLEISHHTVFGLSQLVHTCRDSAVGSRRKSFDRLIPAFLAAKKELQKRPDANPRNVLSKHLKSL